MYEMVQASLVRFSNGWDQNRTTMNHPNTELVRYSSPHCIIELKLKTLCRNALKKCKHCSLLGIERVAQFVNAVAFLIQSLVSFLTYLVIISYIFKSFSVFFKIVQYKANFGKSGSRLEAIINPLLFSYFVLYLFFICCGNNMG